MPVPKITDEQLENWFTHHPPGTEDIPKFQAIRYAGKDLARAIVECCPPSADTTAAVRKVREAVATANMAIACKGQ